MLLKRPINFAVHIVYEDGHEYCKDLGTARTQYEASKIRNAFHDTLGSYRISYHRSNIKSAKLIKTKL